MVEVLGEPQGAPLFTCELESESMFGENSSTRLCPRCQQTPPQPWDCYCQPCRHAYTRAWRKANPERTRELRTAARRRAGIPERRKPEPRPATRLPLRQLRFILTEVPDGRL